MEEEKMRLAEERAMRDDAINQEKLALQQKELDNQTKLADANLRKIELDNSIKQLDFKNKSVLEGQLQTLAPQILDIGATKSHKELMQSSEYKAYMTAYLTLNPKEAFDVIKTDTDTLYKLEQDANKQKALAVVSSLMSDEIPKVYAAVAEGQSFEQAMKGVTAILKQNQGVLDKDSLSVLNQMLAPALRASVKLESKDEKEPIHYENLQGDSLTDYGYNQAIVSDQPIVEVDPNTGKRSVKNKSKSSSNSMKSILDNYEGA